MADEKELIKKRGSFKGRLTTFTNYLNTLDATSMTATDAGELQLRIGKIESLYEQFDEVQLLLECCSDPQVQMAERNTFESLYYKMLAKAQEILTSFCKGNEDDQSSNPTRTSRNNIVKLPTIQLPKFSGSYDNWLEFRDTYTSLIHSNDDIDQINKFHYLRSSLEGTAAVVIQSTEFSASNYNIAWTLLCDRFNNKRLLVQNHVTSLFNIEHITKESSVTLKRIIDQINKTLRALESLGEPVKHWDTLLIHIVTQKLDTKTYREWEEFKGRLDKDAPISFDTFMNFMRNRADLIETIELSRTIGHGTHGSPKDHSKSNTKIKTMISVQDSHNGSNPAVSPTKLCPKCHGEHTLNNCSQFLALDNSARLQLLPNYKICFNCFRSGHFSNRCKKPGCKICRRKHNTLVHVAESKVNLTASSAPLAAAPTATDAKKPVSSHPTANDVCTADSNSNLTLSVNVPGSIPSEVLLSTALVKLYDNEKREHIARAVLDSGSTSCLMTEKLCAQLNLPIVCIDKPILGINNSLSHTSKVCSAPVRSLCEDYKLNIQWFVLPSITDKVPCNKINLQNLSIPSNICLADPNFHYPANVDLLIGADVFWDLLGTQRIKLGDGKPILYETRLGWLVSGPINSGYLSGFPRHIKCNYLSLNTIDEGYEDIQSQLTRFWQLEEVSPQPHSLSVEERLCEDYFQKSTTRLADGRFCVRIPIKQDPNILGNSFNRARQCLFSLERRNRKNPVFSKMYKDFMLEYESLGHMTKCALTDSICQTYYIPHHGVLRESSITTKLRVVFNASSPSTSGISLNNIQMVGPTVQDDLLSILMRFRQHRYVLSADVEKMYRQVAVHVEDRHLQRIVWRDDPSQPLNVYQLNTVTYGTSSAPYLATRCLNQIGLECTDKRIANIIIHDFYVDDMLTGGATVDELKFIRNAVTKELASACMPLQKWRSNEPLLAGDSNQCSVNLNIGSTEPSKTLGLGWSTDTDELCFFCPINVSSENTKRNVLSVIAQIFDPLGLLTPFVITLKMLLQKLWLLKVEWDEPLPREISETWSKIIVTLPTLNSIRIPRCVICNSHQSVELHIFTDASERAYGSCVYVRSVNEAGDVLVRLLFAKGRVTPIKPVTIPRLELCGALMGARLYEKAIGSLRLQVRQVTFWTDSSIVLGWLNMLPSKLNTFVRNRVAEITEKTNAFPWRHVPTSLNPADYITRGASADIIQSLDSWWFGPEFLLLDESGWPKGAVVASDLPEIRPQIALHTMQGQGYHNVIVEFERFSNFSRLLRTVAYMLRFINCCKGQKMPMSYLGEDELQNALYLIIKIVQKESFPEYELLINKRKLPPKSPLNKFNVFLDENNIIRVGGRLNNSQFLYDKKHPFLIQSTHRFTKLLFRHEHKRLMHAGPQLLLATIRDTYWPIGGRNLAKVCYHQCVLCRRMKGQTVNPIMGSYPQQRLVAGEYPFISVGVDYAGPIIAASRQGRGCRHVKVYIAIFICFTTKAIHLELVGDLTSNNYVSALRRFISRRGKPSNIFSDNGTTFVGAYKELSNFLKGNCDSIAEGAVNEGINIHFIPAYSPHFGGLWEAGVKSTKYHLVRVLGNCYLTYEDLNTTLVQIEAILNSRPLTPLSSEPEDLMPLTPGHFLIGRPLTSIPAKDLTDQNASHLSRFQRIELLRQHFWIRWSKEYISELQTRSKWQSTKSELTMGSLVVVKDDHLPPLKWRLGRVVAVHPGSDGVTRVADVKCSNGILRRAFTKICPLPVYPMDVGGK